VRAEGAVHSLFHELRQPGTGLVGCCFRVPVTSLVIAALAYYVTGLLLLATVQHWATS